MFSSEPRSPAPSTLQAVGSLTFTTPPLDGSLALHEIYDFHLKHSPTHPLFVWHSGALRLQTLTWGEVARGTHRAAHFLRRYLKTPMRYDVPPVIAILASTDTVTSLCLMLGLIRAGYQSFWLSPRNSVTGICHLVDSVGASEIIVHSDGPLRRLADAAIAELKIPVHVLPLPAFRDLFPTDTLSFEPFQSSPFKGPDTPAVMMHSSGKWFVVEYLRIINRILIQQCLLPWFGQVDICNEILAVHAVPMFHAQGLLNTCLPLSTGLTLSIFPPDLPTTPPTPERLIHDLTATKSTMLICVPSFLEYWTQNPQSVMTLSKLKAIFCGGAPLDHQSSSIFQANCVQIICYLAATEYGIATLMVPERAALEGSEWLTFSPHLTPVFLPQEDPKIYELVLLSTPIHTPGVINTQIEGRDAYATNDLFSRHPSNPNLWKVHGRTDDQIMLSTGEKTNPGPIEAIIGSSRHAKTCVMFGRGRFQNGIIIEPTEAFDPSDIETLAKFRNDIWPAVEEANRFAPSHSRIFKEMIIVSHPSRPFESTLKNTPKRHLIIAYYQAEIDAVYAAVAESTQEDIPPPVLWTFEDTLPFSRRVVSSVLVPSESPLEDDDDLLARGMDSLQATWIRNSMIRALRESSHLASIKQLPHNFVYTYPSVTALTHHLVDLVAGRANRSLLAASDMSLKIQQMEDLVTKYTQNFPAARRYSAGAPTGDTMSGEVVVLTGSTGSLGSQLLALLVQDLGVMRVYALNRLGGVPVKERQAKMWEDHDLDPLLLRSEKIIFVDFDAGEGLGIAKNIYDEIRASATTIIHNAWTVDFNLTLASFEPNIRALRILMDLALQSPRASPPRFIFTSTVGVLRNWSGPSAVPEAPVPDMALSIGAGYTESKCVAERILGSSNMALRPIVIRVGQLAGAPNGSWRTSEWVPAMVKSGKALGALPEVQGDVSWIPLQVAASALLEAGRTDPNATNEATFVHLVHPRPVLWRVVIKPLADAIGVPLVPYDEWLLQLERSPATAEESPAVKLLDFFKAARLEGEVKSDLIGFPRLETKNTEQKAQRALGRGLEQLGPEDARRWIEHWKRKRFLD